MRTRKWKGIFSALLSLAIAVSACGATVFAQGEGPVSPPPKAAGEMALGQEQKRAASGATVYIDGARGSDSNSGADAANAVKTLEKAQELAGEGGTILLGGKVALNDGQAHTLGGKVVLRRAAGYQGAMIEVAASTLTIEDATVDGNKSEVPSATGSLVLVAGGGSLAIGPNARLIDNARRGVELSGTKTEKARATMSGGEVSGNEGSGVVLAWGGEFRMSGGTVCDNQSFEQGAGVAVLREGAAFYMSGGSVENNTGTSGGGGIGNSDGYVELTGGTVCNNSAPWGGGVGTFGVGTTVLDGGTITGNRADGNGAGAYLEGFDTEIGATGDRCRFIVKSGSITGNSTEGGNGGGIYAWAWERPTIIEIQGGTIADNTANSGEAIGISGDGGYECARLQVSGSPTISGVVNMWDDVFETVKIEVVDTFSPTQPVVLDDNMWVDLRTVVTYEEGLTPDVAQFECVGKIWGIIQNGQDLKRIRLAVVDFWVYTTERYEAIYILPGTVIDPADIPPEAVTKAGYHVVGWERRDVDSGLPIGNWNMKDPVSEHLLLHPIWKLDAPAVSLSADKETVHVKGGEATLTATVSPHEAPHVSYRWQWYKDGEIIADATVPQLDIQEAGEYKVVVIADDGKGLSDPAEATISIAEEGHIYEGWLSDATHHWQACEICGEEAHGAAHNFGEWVIRKEATTEETGRREHSCTVCGYAEEEEIPLVEKEPSGEEEPPVDEAPSGGEEPPVKEEQPGEGGPSDAPQTGDVGGLACAVLASALGLTATVLLVRRRARR